MRVLLTQPPFVDLTKFWGGRGRWPAKWITHPQANGAEPIVLAFRRRFSISQPTTLRIHVSADERYELFLDGQRIGRGSERGDRLNWFFETYDLTLSPGDHVLVARTWWLNQFGPAPFAQISIRPAFILATENVPDDVLNTGVAPWDCKRLAGYSFVHPSMTWGTGAKVHIRGSEFDWGFEHGHGDNWTTPQDVVWGFNNHHLLDQPPFWVLTPATLPPMLENRVQVGTARHVQALNELPTGELPVHSPDNLPDEAAAWTRMLQGQGQVTIPPNTLRRIIVDLDNYYTAYPELITTGGAGSEVRVWWAESLFEPQSQHIKGMYDQRVKGNRDEIEGKTFIGIGDTFEPDGGAHRHLDTLWWEAGRYLEILVKTAADPLTIEQLSLRETHYPYPWTAQFTSSDPRLADVIPIGLRVLEACSHETYMDCPYYEQLMYVGDTRLEVLTTYAWSSDDRLPRKAIRIFDESRKSPGFTQSRYPCRVEQTIPPFSAWWIGMVHDYAMWRDDRAFIAERLPGVRQVLDTFHKYKTSEGLIAGPPGWNYIDWVPGWSAGMPPEADHGLSAALNFKLAWIWQQAAELEDYAGEPELAQLHRRRSRDLATAAVQTFWDDSRGLLADDLAKQHFSEHVQCLALLGDSLPAALRPRLIDGLLSAPDLARTTIYFTHYLFETYRLLHRVDRFFDRMDLWYQLKKLGFRTTVEAPEPSRSDCHAWGAHPLFHYLATILGIRPSAPGFARVRIEPQLGPLTHARGSMPHPKGVIRAEFSAHDGTLSGEVELPAGVSGELLSNGRRIALHPGNQTV